MIEQCDHIMVNDHWSTIIKAKIIDHKIQLSKILAWHLLFDRTLFGLNLHQTLDHNTATQPKVSQTFVYTKVLYSIKFLPLRLVEMSMIFSF